MIHFNREVTIEKKSTVSESTYGTKEFAWTPLSVLPGSPEVAERFPAEVIDLSPGRAESILHGGLAIAQNVTRVRIRWRNDVNSSMRIVVHEDSDRILQIIGGPAEYGGRKVALEMFCEEVSS